MDEKVYYVGFSIFPGIGAALFDRLLQRFGSAESAWNSSEADLIETVGEKITEKFLAFRKTINLSAELENCVQKDIQLITVADKIYPRLLKEIVRPPYLLYVKGDASILSFSKIIGVVGTRKITQYGKQVTEMLTADLVNAGFVTVSGLALGVDACAHTATIDAGGKTIAVLGCGVDCCYPRENQKIYDRILSTGGAIVSNFPPSMEATRFTFPARNALIAGLSQALLVTEGAADSGSLITAEYAKKFRRPLFAVPGPITSSLSKGTNSLLKTNGIAVTSIKDILDSLGIMGTPKALTGKGKALRGSSKEEQMVLDLLENGPLLFDEIVRTIGKDSKNTGSLLSLMELSGLIHQEGGKYYI